MLIVFVADFLSAPTPPKRSYSGRNQQMLIEGFIGQEIARMKMKDIAGEVESAPGPSQRPKPEHAFDLRQQVGDTLIRAGGRLAGISVDPCLDAHRNVRPAGG
jgi:hypothetical protein